MNKLDKIKDILFDEYLDNRLKNSYIFESRDVSTALNLAFDLSKKIFETENLNNVTDFILIKKEDMSIDTIRNIIKNCPVQPFKSKKIYVFEDATKFNIPMQNAFLKTLEEPPEHVIFILIAQNSSNFLETIRSRCIIYFFDEEVQELYEREDIQVMTRKLLDILMSKDAVRMIEYMEEIKKYKSDFDDLFTSLLDNLRNIIIAKESVELLPNKYKQNKYLHDIVGEFTNYELLALIDLVELARKKLNNNCSFTMTIESMLFCMLEVRN